MHAFQTRFNHLEFGAVDHHRHARNIGFGGQQMQEGDHGLLTVQQAFIHIDVDDLRAIDHLIPRHIQRRGVIPRHDQFFETG